MAVELAVAKGSLKETAVELGITPQILTRWRRQKVGSPSMNTSGRAQLSQDQQEIQRLKKELKQAELDRIDFYDSNNNGGIKIFIFFPPLDTGINAMD